MKARINKNMFQRLTNPLHVVIKMSNIKLHHFYYKLIVIHLVSQ